MMKKTVKEAIHVKIGHIIWAKRRAKGLTQEQVAAALGVSAPAVSKWEGNLSFPDITLLPRLARLLGTDLNGLMAFQEELSRQEVGEFLNRLAALPLDQAFSLAREKVGEYPNCALLALNVALTLEGMLALKGEAGPDGWILSLYERAAASEDREVADKAKAMLFSRRLEAGEDTQAEELLAALPRQPLFQRERMEARLALARGDWQRAGMLLESQLSRQVSLAQDTLLSLMDLAAKEGQPRRISPLADHALALAEHFDQWEYEKWAIRLQAACLTQDVEEGLAAVKGLLAALEGGWKPMGDFYAHLPPQGPRRAAGPAGAGGTAGADGGGRVCLFAGGWAVLGGYGGVRWHSTTCRQYEIAPSSVTFGASFPPRGSLRAMLRWGDCYGIFLQ